ncbi:hypothetical protein [Prosthecobacter sp.]|uniref:hypothetical protein n=1 Tax=Prosthecobacter sp. TaxID=1965333 RepID=UPI0025FB7F44|nr:hypothetical protein [Prosthecobacter sp.]
MSDRDATIKAIRSSESLEHDADGTHDMPLRRPDFLARQQALFGNRVLLDSQVIMDDLRAERF